MNKNYADLTSFYHSFRSISSVFTLDKFLIENTLCKTLKGVEEIGNYIKIEKNGGDLFDEKMRPFYNSAKKKIKFLNRAYTEFKMYIYF